MQTYERTRQEGTREIITTDPAVRLAAIRRIVKEKQYAKIDGTMIDGCTASLIVQIYDKLNPQNQEKYSRLSAGRMGQIAWELV